MLPIAILPAAGLLLGLGRALTNKGALAAYPFLDQAWLQTILKVMSFAGNAVFANIALIFTIIQVVEIDEVPLAYHPENANRVKIKVVGNLAR
ncbi:PTS transporter subunit EIIC [Lacticaseibacillus chiayiensis]|uniref:PTS transporter subunit EIIC n=1 Tax=Lacticaseibacillus chiayiensis TaxID=2100821 RepID=A0ABY6H317_9LACO|nr:PTS transporter subunit EIIC [Lacticaseibacillus chiayiensis]UYN55744.1 PTS transporter subunit EIIC [Lacticaseibacillus chiayiensis]